MNRRELLASAAALVAAPLLPKPLTNECVWELFRTGEKVTLGRDVYTVSAFIKRAGSVWERVSRTVEPDQFGAVSLPASWGRVEEGDVVLLEGLMLEHGVLATFDAPDDMPATVTIKGVKE